MIDTVNMINIKEKKLEKLNDITGMELTQKVRMEIVGHGSGFPTERDGYRAALVGNAQNVFGTRHGEL